jgi:hypothetical protein
MKRSFLIVIFTLICSHAFAHENWIMSAQISTTFKPQLDTATEQIIQNKQQLGFGANFGIPIDDYFSLELGYQFLGNSKYQSNSILYSQSVHSLSLSSTFTMPVSLPNFYPFNAYGRLGYEAWEATSNLIALEESGTGLFYGIGAIFDLDRDLDFMLEAQFRNTKAITDLDSSLVTLSSGVKFKF